MIAFQRKSKPHPCTNWTSYSHIVACLVYQEVCLLHYQYLPDVFTDDILRSAHIHSVHFVDLVDGRICAVVSTLHNPATNGPGLFISTFTVYRTPTIYSHDSGCNLPSGFAVEATIVKVDIHTIFFHPTQNCVFNAYYIEGSILAPALPPFILPFIKMVVTLPVGDGDEWR